LTATCPRWEFVTTLGFEWEVFSGKRPWRWSFVVYLIARIFGIVEVALQLAGYSLTREINCNVSSRSGVPSVCLKLTSPDFCVGLVPLYPCCGMVLCSHLLVPPCASWVSDPRVMTMLWSRLFRRSLQADFGTNLESPYGDETK
jgi:hypothetical protein